MLNAEHEGYLSRGLNPMNVIRLEGYLGKVWAHTSKAGRTKQMGNLSVFGMEGFGGMSPLVYVHGWHEAGEALLEHNGENVVVWGTLRGWRRSDGTMAYDVLVTYVERSTLRDAEDFRTHPVAGIPNERSPKKPGDIPGGGDLEL